MAVKYHELMAAKALLNISDRASLSEIKSSYRKLIKQWHPDRGKGSNEQCLEMTQKITGAYKTVISYCNQYQCAFTEKEVKQYLSVEDWWFDRFGDDPLMGKIKK